MSQLPFRTLIETSQQPPVLQVHDISLVLHKSLRNIASIATQVNIHNHPHRRIYFNINDFTASYNGIPPMELFRWITLISQAPCSGCFRQIASKKLIWLNKSL